MNKELAKTLTTALVQFIDKNQPENKMCVSSIEAEELERCFTEEKFNRVEDWCAFRMKPELTEFEKCMLDFAKARDEYEYDSTKVVELNNKVIELTKFYADKLLALAKKELLKEWNENMKDEYARGKKDGLTIGYNNGYKDAEKQHNKPLPIVPILPAGWGCDGTHCTNPHYDCINCPRKYSSEGTITTPNTASLTSEWNTSATDGKEHNPSFTD